MLNLNNTNQNNFLQTLTVTKYASVGSTHDSIDLVKDNSHRHKGHQIGYLRADRGSTFVVWIAPGLGGLTIINSTNQFFKKLRSSKPARYWTGSRTRVGRRTAERRT